MITTCFVAAAAITVATVSLADDYATLGWERVFTDEFNGSSVDATAWNLLNRRDSFNNEKQYYRDTQVTALDGHARLTAVNEPFGGKQYQSGLIRTHQEWSYGRFEVRADLPTSQGMWPAIWLLPRTVDWPTGGEIDIMENKGSESEIVSSAYHWQNDPSIPCCGARQYVFDEYSAFEPGVGPVDYHAGYHTYAAEWEPGVVRFYVDDFRHFEIREDSNLTVFDTAKSLIINLAVGGIFDGDPDASTVWPQHFDIDYVRIWQRENGFTGVVNGGFDENGGSLNDWQTWNDSGANLSVSPSHATVGDSSLRLAAAGTSTSAGAYQSIAIDGGERLRARAHSLVPAGDAFDGGSDVAMKVEFYSTLGGDYGSPAFLGEQILTIADATHELDVWRQNELVVDAPLNAVEARYTFIVDGSGGSQGVGYLDAASLVAVPALDGDFNFDGRVDAADYTVWRDTLGSPHQLAADADRNGVVEVADYAWWYTAMNATNVTAVPEPTAAWLCLTVMAGLPRGRSA
ncbi:MAG: family 16 glycosylhydrolase [Planctomycetota bacterium]